MNIVILRCLVAVTKTTQFCLYITHKRPFLWVKGRSKSDGSLRVMGLWRTSWTFFHPFSSQQSIWHTSMMLRSTIIRLYISERRGPPFCYSNSRASGRSIPGYESIRNKKIREALMGVYVGSETSGPIYYSTGGYIL